ncbi:MAG: zinc ribbon domain-containing protein [Prevotella sp.]|nr:zinc ribbon domain-containing protein [Prevotella sp.]
MAIIKCPECGQQISDEATVCPICGEKIAGNIVKCTKCGEVYFKDYGICPHCYSILPHGERRVADEADLAEEEPEHGKEEAPQQTVETESPTPSDEKATTTTEDGESTPSDDKKPSEATRSSDDDEETEEELSYIDTDGEALEKPIHIADEDTTTGSSGKHNFIPIIVSLAITALIAAVCLYFYNDSKLSRENQAFQMAINSGNVNEMNSFLRTYTDASVEHKAAIKDKIADVTKQKEDLSMSVVTRDKVKILQYLTDYPDTPLKSTLLSMIDSIDWETALASDKKKAYEKYIAEHGNGLFVKEAKEKIAVKVVETTPEDEAKAKSLFREFFLSVNGNDASRLTATLGSSLTTFMGTSNAGTGDVVSWMHRQHGEDVSNVIWKLNHDYKITKREQSGELQSTTVEFTAKRTIIRKDGHAGSEHFKVTSMVNKNNKVSSMSMTKYTPSSSEQSSSSSSTSSTKKEGTSSSSSSSSNKQSSSSSSKPSSSSSTQKPSSSSSTQKSSSSSSTQKSSSSSSSQKSSSSSSSQKSSSSSSSQKSSSSSSSKKSSGSSSSQKSSGSSNSQKSSGSSSSKNNSGSSTKTTTNSSGNSSTKSSSTKQNTGSKSSSKGSSGSSSKSSNTKSGSSSGKTTSSNSSKPSNSSDKK